MPQAPTRLSAEGFTVLVGRDLDARSVVGHRDAVGRDHDRHLPARPGLDLVEARLQRIDEETADPASDRTEIRGAIHQKQARQTKPIRGPGRAAEGVGDADARGLDARLPRRIASRCPGGCRAAWSGRGHPICQQCVRVPGAASPRPESPGPPQPASPTRGPRPRGRTHPPSPPAAPSTAGMTTSSWIASKRKCATTAAQTFPLHRTIAP